MEKIDKHLLEWTKERIGKGKQKSSASQIKWVRHISCFCIFLSKPICSSFNKVKRGYLRGVV